MNYIKDNTKEYLQKTYAGWLGKIIGIQMGSPFEGWTYEQIKGKYGFIDRYVQSYEDYAADDDSNGPLFFVRSILDSKKKESDLNIEDMAETWLNYVCNGHGFFWWGGYGVSTEHTTYNNLKQGISPYVAGSIKQNGHTIAEQIGGQIFIDSWGFVKPAAPMEAAALAKKMIAVSHDGEALWGGAFIVACISAAYRARSVEEIIEKALPVLPLDSDYYRVVDAVRNYYTKDKDKDWEGCFRFIKANFGYDRYPGNCHIIPNAALIILSLLYGEGDYAKSIFICNSCGWDTDCNAGNVGSILGVFRGIGNIPDELVVPVKDLVLASSAVGYLNINTISETALMFAKIGCRLAGMDENILIEDKYQSYKKFYNFDLEKSTNALRPDRTIAMQNILLENSKRALRFYGKGEVCYKTYYCPSDLTDSRYDPSFSPLIYPGENFGFNFTNDSAEKMTVKLFYRDRHSLEKYYSKEYTIQPGMNIDAIMTIPSGNALIDRIGFILDKGAIFLLNHFFIGGKVDYSIDFSKETEENYGFSNGKLHTERSQFTFSQGYWEYKNGYLTGSCASDGETLTGEYNLRDYELDVKVLPVRGEHHMVIFRALGYAKYYALMFGPDNTLSVVKKHLNNYKTIKTIDFVWKHDKEYSVSIKACGDSFEISVDNQSFGFTDSSYEKGCYGFAILDGSRCRFKDLSVKEK